MELIQSQRFRARVNQIARAARRDPATFIRWMARVEGGAMVRMADVHREWHDILTKNDNVVLFAPVGHGKTSQITRWRLLWEIGNNPNIRCAIVSATKQLPTKAINGIRQDIEGSGPSSTWLRAVFPHLRRSNWAVWTSEAISLHKSSNLTVTAYSPGSQILGSRLDLIIVDDIHDIRNTLTPEARERVYRWLTTEVFSRDSPVGTKIWVLGHVWHEDDALHRLVREAGFTSFKYSCYKEDAEGVKQPLIPEIWTLKKLQARERRLGPISSKLMLYNELVDAGTGRIKREYFRECLRRGSTLGPDFATHWSPGDAPTVTGVDLGFGGGSLTAIFTVAVLPDATRRVLDLRSGSWSGRETIDQLIEVNQNFGSTIFVESNGAQVLLEEYATELTALPIKKHVTGVNKHELRTGVEGMAIELTNQKWQIPCAHQPTATGDLLFLPNKELTHWINECVAYTADTHAGDRLMASWICREGIRQLGLNRPRRLVDPGFYDVDTLTR